MLVHIADHKDTFSEDEFTRYLTHIWHNLAKFYDGIWERRARLLEYVDEETEDFKEALLNFIACARFLPSVIHYLCQYLPIRYLPKTETKRNWIARVHVFFSMGGSRQTGQILSSTLYQLFTTTLEKTWTTNLRCVGSSLK